MRTKRNRTAEEKKSIKKQKNKDCQQRYRDTHKHTEKYQDSRRKRYQKAKAKLKSEENCLLLKHCVNNQNKNLIKTPVGLIEYSLHNSHFVVHLESDCTALNVKGNGSYGLAVKKGSYCYKISVATQDGKGGVENKVNIRCVKKFHDKVDEIVVKSIRLSKACHTSFERESLHEVSKIKDLKHCTASYIGK